MKFQWILFTFSLLAGVVNAQTVDTLDRHWPRYISLDQYLQPFLTADTIYDELVMPLSDGNSLPNGKLLFPVKTILSVRDAYLGQTFEEGKDWVWEGQRLILTDSSRIPFFREQDLVYSEKQEGYSQPGKLPGTYVLFSEGELFHAKQLAVTYLPDRSGESLHRRLPHSEHLPRTLQKLQAHKPLHVVFYGNSIETGANSSGVQHVPPFMPNWTELFIYRLRQHFGGKISYSNQAVGGKTAAWGVEEVDSRVSAQHPDLVVIGFGMNDGTFKVAPEEFVGQIKAIMDHVSRDNPTCEFIVITPMLANPTAIQHQVQLAYRNPLLALSKRGVAVADMTYWHQWLLTHKAYQDMTGNNINHPNDYLARWYAQVLIALLIEYTPKI